MPRVRGGGARKFASRRSTRATTNRREPEDVGTGDGDTACIVNQEVEIEGLRAGNEIEGLRIEAPLPRQSPVSERNRYEDCEHEADSGHDCGVVGDDDGDPVDEEADEEDMNAFRCRRRRKF